MQFCNLHFEIVVGAATVRRAAARRAARPAARPAASPPTAGRPTAVRPVACDSCLRPAPRGTDPPLRPVLSLALALALLLLSAVPRPASADLVLDRTLREKVTRPLGEVTVRTRRERVSLAADRVRLEDLQSGEYLIFRLDKGLFWRVDANARTVAEVTFDELRRLETAFRGELREVLARLDPASDEARRAAALLAALEAAAAPGPETSAAEDGRREAIAGETAGHLVLTAGGRSVFEGWLVPAPAEGPVLYRVLGAVQAVPGSLARALEGLGRIPLRSSYSFVLFRDRLEVDEEVTRVERGEVPAAEFEPPAGFRSVPLRGYLPLEAAREVPRGGVADDGKGEDGRPEASPTDKPPKPREGRGDRHD
ncbi:MAG: hypothetical protein HYZ53_20470 [Planctomycetes bacterium]|nr:hypothetical protein [Planctomycetota bacterium]